MSAQVLPEFVRAVVHMLDQADLPTFKVDTVAVDAIFETRGGASWVALGQGSCKDSNGGLRTAAVFQCSDFSVRKAYGSDLAESVRKRGKTDPAPWWIMSSRLVEMWLWDLESKPT